MKKSTSTYEHFRLAAVLIAFVLVISCGSNKQVEKTEKESTNSMNSPKKEYSQFVLETTDLYRYEFPTHINDTALLHFFNS